MVLAQPFNDRAGGAVVELDLEFFGFLLDNGDGPFDFAGAQPAVFLADDFQIVNAVQKDVVVEIVDSRLEIARHPQIENEDRLTAALFAHPPKPRRIDQRGGRAGRADDHVGLGHPIVELLEGARDSPTFGGHLCGPFGCAVGHYHLASSRFFQISQRFDGHFAGANHKHRFVVKTIENRLAKFPHGDAGDRNASLGQRRFGPHPLGDIQRPLEQCVGQRAGGGMVLRQRVGFFDLRHDLRFSQHHAVQARSHFEQVLNDIRSLSLYQIVEKLDQRHMMKLGKELRHVLLRRNMGGILLGRIDLNPIARRQHHPFGPWKCRAQGGICPGHLLARKREPLADAEVCRVVVAINDLQIQFVDSPDPTTYCGLLAGR